MKEIKIIKYYTKSQSLKTLINTYLKNNRE